jgi:hypothetical protein
LHTARHTCYQQQHVMMIMFMRWIRYHEVHGVTLHGVDQR